MKQKSSLERTSGQVTPIRWKPGRSALKKPKDRRQGKALMDACAQGTLPRHPIDEEFERSLPDALRPVFDQWMANRIRA